jgi:hypothetical protein
MLCYWHAKNRVDQTQVTEQLLPVTQEKLMMPNAPRTPRRSRRSVISSIPSIPSSPLPGGAWGI